MTKNHSFSVTDVEVAKVSLADTSYVDGLKSKLGEFDACSQNDARLVKYHSQLHSFIATLLAAFNDHRPLSISPDHIWLLISQGFANHVNENAEQLRKQLVDFDGTTEIKVTVSDKFHSSTKPSKWEDVLQKFCAELESNIGAELHNNVVSKFSTTGPVEKCAFQISLMEAMSPYFSYKLMTICGIPQITLEGTTEDWQSIVTRGGQVFYGRLFP